MNSNLPRKFNEKYCLYLMESQKNKDAFGWCSRMKCDGLLFNALWAISGTNIDILQARDATGKWHRHPSMQCYSMHQSKSEISRDMFVGLYLYCIVFRRPDIVDELIYFGKRNNWIMGHGDISRTYLTPSMQATLYEIRYRLTGENSFRRWIPRDWYRPMPFAIASSIKGYQRHVQILHIFSNILCRGPSKREIELLEFHKNSQPGNALYSAIYHLITDNDFQEPIEIMMNDNLFPQYKLPTSHNFDSDYLWQRDIDSNDWLPRIDKNEVSPAIDWLFTATIIREGFKWQL